MLMTPRWATGEHSPRNWCSQFLNITNATPRNKRSRARDDRACSRSWDSTNTKPCGHAVRQASMKHNAEEMAPVPVVRSEIEVVGSCLLRLHAEARGRRAVHHSTCRARRMPTSSRIHAKPASHSRQEILDILNSTRRRIGCRRSPRIRHASADEETKEDPGGTGFV